MGRFFMTDKERLIIIFIYESFVGYIARFRVESTGLKLSIENIARS